MQAPPACRFYRERAAGMYASYPFSAAQAIVELPYVGVQAVLYCCITYWMVSCALSMHSASGKISVLSFVLCSAVGEAPNAQAESPDKQ